MLMVRSMCTVNGVLTVTRFSAKDTKVNKVECSSCAAQISDM